MAEERARLAWSARVAVLATAVLVPACLYFAFAREHLNLADEGYLWYGVQRTLAGEVPLRDFQAYDPGRYHWCALLAPLLGDGILGVRAAVALYAVLGLAAGLAVLARVVRAPAGLVLAGILLGLWLFPRHKLFEPATALLLAWTTVRMLAEPTSRRHFVAGLAVGLAGFMGRNHALYGALAGAAALALDAWKDPRAGRLARAGAWAGGIAAGCAPLAALLLFVPGFARALSDSVRLFVEHGANLPKPWPWPWSMQLGLRMHAEGLRPLVECAAFLLPVLAAPVLLWASLRSPRETWRARAPLVGTTLVGLVYLHHASVRSDMPHLAQSLPVLLLALLVLPLATGRGRAVALGLWSALFALSAAVWANFNPSVVNHSPRAELTAHVVAGEELWLNEAQARYLGGVERTVRELVGEAPMFIAPSRPTLYCVLAKRAPTWWIAHYWRLPPAEQDATIVRLSERGVDWALIVDAPVEDRADLLFRSTNERVWAHFQAEWQRVAAPALPDDHVLLRRR